MTSVSGGSTTSNGSPRSLSASARRAKLLAEGRRFEIRLIDGASGLATGDALEDRIARQGQAEGANACARCDCPKAHRQIVDLRRVRPIVVDDESVVAGAKVMRHEQRDRFMEVRHFVGRRQIEGRKTVPIERDASFEHLPKRLAKRRLADPQRTVE